MITCSVCGAVRDENCNVSKEEFSRCICCGNIVCGDPDCYERIDLDIICNKCMEV